VTLLTEWPAGAATPTEYWLTSLGGDTPLRRLVGLARMRRRIEHGYREVASRWSSHFRIAWFVSSGFSCWIQ